MGITETGSKTNGSPLTAVAMSGGLDSSVTAWMLARRKEPVLGLSMLLWDRSGEESYGRCCAALDLADAKRVAQQIGIPHFTLRMDEDFRRTVVDPFVHDYLEGRTPNPCARCNTWVKFDLFLERARSLGASHIATGHYARIIEGPDGWQLHASVDLDKDQSYYLFELTQEQLSATIFPLGEMEKADVRQMARDAGLLVAEKGESMEVCFVSSGIREFVEEQVQEHPDKFSSPHLREDSRIVDRDGALLGRGQPVYRYTVGQRKGLGLAAPSPLYVLGLDAEQNEVIVGSEDELLQPGLYGERLHWIGPDPPGEIEAVVKIRSRHPGVAARIRPLSQGLSQGRVEVEFAEPQKGVAPGQAAVFYDGSRVLGGCWIEKGLS